MAPTGEGKWAQAAISFLPFCWELQLPFGLSNISGVLSICCLHRTFVLGRLSPWTVPVNYTLVLYCPPEFTLCLRPQNKISS